MPESTMKREDCVCTVEVSPEDEIDAGADITLTVRVECPGDDDLVEPRVSIRDHESAELATAALKPSDDDDDDRYVSDDIVVAAPRTAGEHVYRAVVLVADKDGAPQELTSAEVRLGVKPHTAHMNIWDVPSAIVAGERFRFVVGVKCSAGCDLRGRALRIAGAEGSQAVSATLADAFWPGTDGLHFVEVETEAPAAPGSHQWEVRTAEWDLDLPHAAGSAALGLKVVNSPDCEITVEARV